MGSNPILSAMPVPEILVKGDLLTSVQCWLDGYKEDSHSGLVR
jgi:hypothetical protein